MKRPTLVTIGALLCASMMLVGAGDAWARVGGGGSRGSRSFSAPARPSPWPATPTPSSPSRSLSQPAAPVSTPQRPSFFRGIMGGLAGFALGGLLGGLLFGGLGRGFGFGLMDIILIGGAVLLLVMFLRRRRETTEPAYATASAYGSTGQGMDSSPTSAASVQMPAGRDDLERGVGYIQQMDPSFDPVTFADRARTEFTNVQSVLAVRDVNILRDRLTPEMAAVLEAQCSALKSAGRTNFVQKIDIDRADVTEAWQESGQDFVTVYFAGSMIDFTVDDRTGAVVEGSKTDPQKVEEFWTFTRAVGRNPWRLSAIQSA
jgi:predicted lipid-binding transport protein (Tim44 family)